MNKKVFLSPVLNDEKDSADRAASGRLFQIRGTAHENRLAAKLMLCGGTALERSRRVGGRPMASALMPSNLVDPHETSYSAVTPA